MDKTFTIETHPERVDGPSEKWQIAANDWRDGDRLLVLDGAQVYPLDPQAESGLSPDWSLGWEIRWGDRSFVDVAPDRPINPHTRMTFKGTGQPPEILEQAYLEGRVLFGVICARDLQKHNA